MTHRIFQLKNIGNTMLQLPKHAEKPAIRYRVFQKEEQGLAFSALVVKGIF
ncbi:MAG: hypothetical protein ACJASL_002017 [Paraglaciecola sp.]|jgi:hypothetical protein